MLALEKQLRIESSKVPEVMFLKEAIGQKLASLAI